MTWSLSRKRADRKAVLATNTSYSCLEDSALDISTPTTMNALVGYGSSDEEEEDVLPQRPAKVGLC